MFLFQEQDQKHPKKHSIMFILLVMFSSLLIPITTETNLLGCFLVERGNTKDVYDYDKAAGAVDLAVEWVNDNVLPETFLLNTLYIDIGSKCTGSSSIMAHAMALWSRGIKCDAYFGPGCGSTGQILYNFADFLNIPIFGLPAASVGMVASLDAYPLLIRVSLTHSTLADVLLRFFANFNYVTPYFLYDNSDSFFNEMGILLAASIQSKAGAMYYSYKFQAFESNGLTDQKIKRLLFTASKLSRVILFLANSKITRQFMINAYDLDMIHGEYVFVAVELFDSPVWGKFTWRASDNNSENDSDKVARVAYHSLLLLSIKLPTDESLNNFWIDVKVRSKAKFNYTFPGKADQPDVVVAHFYDTIYLYATLVKTMVSQGIKYTDGQAMGQLASNFTFFSIPFDRKVRLDENGDRISTYVIRNFDPISGIHDDLYVFPSASNAINVVAKLSWPNGANLPPNTPLCGFDGLAAVCQLIAGLTSGTLTAAILVPVVVAVNALVGAVWVYRRFAVNKDDPFWWRITFSQLRSIGQQATMDGSIAATRSGMKKSIAESSVKTLAVPYTTEEETFAVPDHLKSLTVQGRAPFTETFLMDGVIVGLSELPDPKHRISKTLAKELKPLRNLHHVNIQNFIGIAVSEDNLCSFIVGEVCSRGNLHVLLSKMKMNLDWTFKLSLLMDLANGMAGLHSSSIGSHGNLTSFTCLVDSQFVLKITDHGLSILTRNSADFEAPEAHHSDRDFSQLYWRAPELLRQTMPPNGTQKGDVYSFSIIMQQLILRSPPFKQTVESFRRCGSAEEQLKTREVILEVKHGSNPPLRPPVPVSACSRQLYELMERCWEEEPTVRPTFTRIKSFLVKATPHSNSNIVDGLIKTMEQYALTLELQVEEQMRNFMEEKERSEQILSLILPKPVALALTRGQKVLPETFGSTTIYFSDVAGFSDTIARTRRPHDVVHILNLLYNVFDAVMEKFDVYKMETLNDAYLVVSGLPLPNGKQHAEQIATMSLNLLQQVENFLLDDQTSARFKLRVGINSGPCVAGIVGLKMPRYCIFGDTVNTGARMETHGEAGRIHCSPSTKFILDQDFPNQFALKSRGLTDIKGKGTMETYWLLKKF